MISSPGQLLGLGADYNLQEGLRMLASDIFAAKKAAPQQTF